MTLVAIDAVVDVPGHVVVMEVVGIIPTVATGALKYGVVIRVDVAGGADVVRVTVARWELRVLPVVECGAGPGRGVVAGLASRREELGLRRMSRVRSVVVVGLMTADAGRGQRRVIVVDVAVCALPRRHCVHAGQRERRVVMVKGGVRPGSGVVTQFARGGKAGRGVGRIGRAGVILLVARVAQRAVEAVVIVDVAIRALPRRHRVHASQRESGGGVVEGGIGPGDRVVTGLAGGRESGRDMVHGSDRIVVIGLVAGHAGGVRQIVVIVDVAIRTLPRRYRMHAGEREAGAVVIEGRIEPG